MTTDPTNRPARSLDDVLDQARDRAWPGPDHNPKVDAFLSEQTMTTQRKTLSKPTIALALAALVGGGAVTAAVTHQIMTQRATLITEDGTEYDVLLSPTPDGAAGTFVTDDGQEFGIDIVNGAAERTVSVEMSEADDGSAAVVVPLNTPGNGATFIDEDGNQFEVDPAAADNWTSDEE